MTKMLSVKFFSVNIWKNLIGSYLIVWYLSFSSFTIATLVTKCMLIINVFKTSIKCRTVRANETNYRKNDTPV